VQSTHIPVIFSLYTKKNEKFSTLHNFTLRKLVAKKCTMHNHMTRKWKHKHTENYQHETKTTQSTGESFSARFASVWARKNVGRDGLKKLSRISVVPFSDTNEYFGYRYFLIGSRPARWTCALCRVPSFCSHRSHRNVLLQGSLIPLLWSRNHFIYFISSPPNIYLLPLNLYRYSYTPLRNFQHQQYC
jgi:hypothetical protein